MKAIVVCSGGLDSVTLAYKLAAEQAVARLMSFDYGQRHKTELARARSCAARLAVPHDIVDITAIGRLLTGSALTGSALTGSTPVPDGHYAEETMRTTVVPNRNAIMLTVAFGRAVAAGADAVAVAVHGGDHFIYPDCRPGFIEAFATMQRQALDGVAPVSLYAPFLHGDKAAIVREGRAARRALRRHLVLLQGRRDAMRPLRHLRRAPRSLRSRRRRRPDPLCRSGFLARGLPRPPGA